MYSWTLAIVRWRCLPAIAPACPAATATRALRLRTRLVDGEGTSVQLSAVERGYRLLRFRVIGHLNEAKPLGLPSIAVGDDAYALYGSVGFKHGSDRIFR